MSLIRRLGNGARGPRAHSLRRSLLLCYGYNAFRARALP